MLHPYRTAECAENAEVSVFSLRPQPELELKPLLSA